MSSWTWPLALAACLLLSVAGHVYLWTSASTKARQAEARVAGLERELHTRDAELLALAKPSVDLPGMFVLPLPSAGATRSSSASTEIRIPSGMQTVLLRVPIPSGEPSTRLALTVTTTAGETVWEASPISPDPSHQTVSVFVPARLLPDGRYKASLFDARSVERTEIAYFVFSIVP